MPLQSFAMQLGGGHALVENGLLHELEHDHGIEHHHDEDGSVHYDDSDESKEHVQHHCASPCHFLLTGMTSPVVNPGGQGEAPRSAQSFVPDPDLEDPERPPVFAPGTATGG
jgi:hypothetical protein